MSLSLLTSARLLTPAGPVADAWLRIEDGRIAAFDSGPPPTTEGEVLDVAGATVTPGLVDVHVHGGDGNETMGGGPQGLTAMARFHARHGVTSLLPSTWTAPHAEVLAALRDVAEVTGPVDGGATILGAHVEGPYINVARKGAHRQELIRPADRAEAGELLDTDVVRLLALAPEIDANHWLLDACVERGVTVAAGHTDATYAQLASAAERGVRQATHVFNGMRGLHHREPGAAGGALALDSVRCELIADGVHVAAPVMDLVWRAKGPDGTLLITDAGKGAGLPDGEYERAGRTITVAGGVMRLEDGTITGSTATLEVGLRRFLAATGTTLDEAWQVATLTPARAIGIAERKGSIEVGKDADLAVFDEAGAVTATVVEGRLVHRT